MTLTPNLIDPQAPKAWRVSLETASDAVTGLNAIKTLGWTGNIDTDTWSISLKQKGKKDVLKGENGCWIYTDWLHVDLLSNEQFIAIFTDNVPLVWDATASTPTALPQSGLGVHILCAAPTSANGPWNYSIRLIDSSGNATEINDQPTLANGQLMWNITCPAAGDYTATITCTTRYAGVEATSLPTASFTAAQ